MKRQVKHMFGNSEVVNTDDRRVLVPVYIVSWETRRVASVGSNGFVDGFSDGYGEYFTWHKIG